MAIFTTKPTNVLQIDDKSGNGYTIYTVNHTQTAATDDIAVELDASVIAVKHIESVGQTVVTVTLDASPSTSTWTVTAQFPSEAASGTYVFCARHVGSAASTGGFKGDL